MSIPSQRVLPRPLKIEHGPLPVLHALKVHRQFRRDLPGSLSIRRLFPLANLSMQARAATRAEPLIQHLLIQRMPKPIAPADRPVRPRRQLPLRDELPPLRQLLTELFSLIKCSPHPYRHTRRTKLRPCHTRHLQHLLLCGGAGEDVLIGSRGKDTLIGRSGNDDLVGNEEDDTLDGGADDDTLTGGAGLDSLDGGAGNDKLLGNEDNDTLTGGSEDDILNGGAGDDTLKGEEGRII